MDKITLGLVDRVTEGERNGIPSVLTNTGRVRGQLDEGMDGQKDGW
jgi:hypothetical protein